MDLKINFSFPIFFLLAILILTSCNKDSMVENNPDNQSDQMPNTQVNANLAVQVKDDNEKFIRDVAVTINNELHFTNKRGYYKSGTLPLEETGSLVSFVKDGYFPNSKFVKPQEGSTELINTQLVTKRLVGEINTENIEEICTDDQFVIDFKESQFVNEEGVPYEGTVKVYSKWINPSN